MPPNKGSTVRSTIVQRFKAFVDLLAGAAAGLGPCAPEVAIAYAPAGSATTIHKTTTGKLDMRRLDDHDDRRLGKFGLFRRTSAIDHCTHDDYTMTHAIAAVDDDGSFHTGAHAAGRSSP
jgi:hypothetical protein